MPHHNRNLLSESLRYAIYEEKIKYRLMNPSAYKRG